MEIRPATLEDVPEMARTMAEGFESYWAFAPPAYTPPTAEVEAQRMAARIAGPDAWAVVAVDDDGRQAGHVSLLADAESPPGECAYLWQLFLRRAHHGTGLATRLHELFLEAARERGYRRARLRTPAGQARARAFYEREGWVADPEPQLEPMLNLDLITYRRAGLASSASPDGVRS